MIVITSQDIALTLLYSGELHGKTPAEIRTQAGQMLRDGDITTEVHAHIQDTIRRWGTW